MKRTIIPIGLALGLAARARAADIYTPITLTPGSFNADVVVERTAPQPIEGYVTACPDGGTNLTGNGWFEQGWYPTVPTPGLLPPWGLPPHGTSFTAQYLDPSGLIVTDPTHVYTMPPDYTTNNALFVSQGNGPQVATITINNPATFVGLSLLNSSGNGGETIGYTVHHQDGSTETGSFVSTDWWHGSGSAPFPVWMAHCLMSVEGGNLQQIGGNNGDLYNNDITVSGASPVDTITFTNTSGGRMNLFGISGSTDGVTFATPLALSGFNADMIIESNAPAFGQNLQYCTATMERGTALWGKVYFEKGFAGQTTWGMPAAGSTITNQAGDHAFVMAPSYAAPNAMCVCSNGWGQPSGTFTLTSPASYAALSVLCGATWGPKYFDVTVHHQDTSIETFPGVGAPDWWNTAATIAASANGGYPAVLGIGAGYGFEVDNTTIDTGNNGHYRAFAVDITLANPGSPVTSVDLAYNTDLNPGNSPSGVIFIFGLAGSTGATTPSFLPVPVTGYNEDMVVEQSAVFRPSGLYGVTTASMDGGTNNTGNTWCEQGFFKQFPATGLPPAGSTVHSLAQPGTYQMPATYVGNNAIYIDSTHTNANLTPATPARLAALSVLSADANGRVTNQCILQYQDGTQDVQTFVSQDWFNNTPFAFTSQGRVNLDNPSLNNDPGHNGGNPTTNPRLYEAQFGLSNTNSPLTNVVLNLLGTQNANGRMVVLAVSAATGAYPVIFRGIAQNTTVGIEVTNLVFSCAQVGGAQPITYNWQVQSNGVWVNLADGFAGALGTGTLTNTIATYPGWMTNAGSPFDGACAFRLQASNAAATVVSPTATVTLRSGYPDLPVPGDAISAFGASTGDAGPPGNIDDLVGGNPDVKCLWNANANVGFITTPSVGGSIARSIRLYWANDADVRDPATVILDGSNDGGVTWVNILPQTGITHNTARNSAASVAPNPLTQAMQEFDFYTNTAAYTSYRVTFPTVFSTSGNGLTQIGEVEILGVSLNTTPPFFSLQPPAAETVFVGASPTFTVEAGGAPPLHYQWYSNNVAIANAKTNTFKLATTQSADSGSQFYCTVQNGNGSTNSSAVTLNVVARPTQAYPVAVLGDNPIAYYRLDELPDNGIGNNGTIANDYVGGFIGNYTNAVLGAAGYAPSLDPDTAAGFGTFSAVDSLVDNIGLSFAAPTGSNAAFSVEAWVKASSLQTVDAGIITVGYGGFEQLNLDCGGADPAHNFRFYVRDVSGATHGSDGTISPNDLLWHHVVGVCDEAHSNVVLYVDGIQNALTTGFNSGLGLLAPTTPMTIGSRRQNTTSDYNYQFAGTIDDVAIYNYALSSNQVQAHFFASAPPPIFTGQPTNSSAPEGSTAVLYSSAYGPGTLGYQWYQSVDTVTWTPMAGMTSNNLALANVSAAAPPAGQQGEYFQVVVTNVYGAITSAPAQLIVVYGPPVILSDLPLSQSVLAGSMLTLAVQVSGSFPFSYQWTYNGGNLSDGGRISGAQSNILTIADVLLSDAGSYQVVITNVYSAGAGSPTLSTADAITVMPDVGFNDNGTNWQLQGTGIANSPPQPRIVNGVLTLTDNGQGENASAYFLNRVYIAAPFQASFTYQVRGGVAGGEADGACFLFHNDPRGPSVLSGGGGSFGIAGVQPSAELEINIYPPSNGGEGIAFNVNGNLGNYGGQPNLPTAPVILDTGDHIDFVLTYYGNVVGLTLTDEENHATFGSSFNLNALGTTLPELVGDTMAYVGFSGADGGVSSYQEVSNFKLVSLPVLTVNPAGPNAVAITWPQLIGAFALQSRSSLNSGTWQPVNAPITGVNGQYQVLISPATGTQFYRLVQQ